MVRTTLGCMVLIGGLAACGSSGNHGGSTTGNGGTGGTGGTDGGNPDGGSVSCGTADYVQGTCAWPDYCLSQKCTPAQNVTAAGNDSPEQACDISAPQGSGNLDSDRASSGKEPLAPDSPIITQLSQVLIQGDSDCQSAIGHNSAQFEEDANACSGGATDAAGRAICAAGEAVMLFQGSVFDPQSLFKATESTDLDGQFYWLDAPGSPIAMSAPGTVGGAAITGFVIPGTGWTTSGGPFTIAQCILGGIQGNYPVAIAGSPVTLHFADTGVAGNSFCAQWQE
jgi:hypothetical protein